MKQKHGLALGKLDYLIIGRQNNSKLLSGEEGTFPSHKTH